MLRSIPDNLKYYKLKYLSRFGFLMNDDLGLTFLTHGIVFDVKSVSRFGKPPCRSVRMSAGTSKTA